jgi:RNA-directed DNA polymerase
MNIELSEVFEAYFDCRKGKRNTFNASAFEENLESNVIDLHRDLTEGCYVPGRHICFVVRYPTLREIWAADFRDRVVQTLFYNRYLEKFHNRFIYDSYACIPGKGALRGAERLKDFCRRATQNWSKPCYYLKADVANFFVAINKDVLYRILCKVVVEEEWQNLARVILFNDPREGVLIRGDKNLLSMVPERKSLFRCADNKGLPIGNLTSQFFANIYLDQLDQFVKHTLKCKFYTRYVDDFVILGSDPGELNDLYEKINEFLKEDLELALHNNKKRIAPIEQGVDFVGYVIKPWRTYLRRRVIKNLNRKIEGLVGIKQAKYEDYAPSVNSYLGFLRQVSGYNKRKALALRLGHAGIAMDPSLLKVL